MQGCIVFLVRVQCRRKESSRSLSHLLYVKHTVIDTHTTKCLVLLFFFAYCRSALRRIFERDDTSSRNLILCVSMICSEVSVI